MSVEEKEFKSYNRKKLKIFNIIFSYDMKNDNEEEIWITSGK